MRHVVRLYTPFTTKALGLTEPYWQPHSLPDDLKRRIRPDRRLSLAFAAKRASADPEPADDEPSR